jgi:SAM-dependent methyltransferase
MLVSTPDMKLAKTPQRRSLEAFLARFASAGKMLDVGGGDRPDYGELFPNRLCIDIRRARDVRLLADAHRLPFAGATFERVLSIEVLEHLCDPVRAIDEMRRVLAPGGLLLLTTRFTYPLHSEPHDYFRYTEHGLRHLFREGWRIDELNADTSNAEGIATSMHYAIFANRGWRWALPKLAWTAFWQLSSARWQPKLPSVRPVCPGGYHLVARRA